MPTLDFYNMIKGSTVQPQYNSLDNIAKGLQNRAMIMQQQYYPQQQEQQIANQAQQIEQQRLANANAQRAQADEEMTRQIGQQSPTYEAAAQNAWGAGRPDIANYYEQLGSKYREDLAANRLAKVKMLSNIFSSSDMTPEQYEAGKQFAIRHGYATPDEIPPTYDPNWVSVLSNIDSGLGREIRKIQFDKQEEHDAEMRPQALKDLNDLLAAQKIDQGQYAILLGQINSHGGPDGFYKAPAVPVLKAMGEKVAAPTKAEGENLVTTLTAPVEAAAAAQNAAAATSARIEAEAAATRSGAKPLAPTEAQLIAKTGLMVDKMMKIKNAIASGDINAIDRTIAGAWTKADFDAAMAVVDEIYSRDQSGAAIARSELNKFRSQIVDIKKLLTKEGKAAVVRNLDDMLTRYLTIGKGVTTNENWFQDYQKSGAEMLGALPAAPGAPIKIKDEAGYKAVPPGALYIDPNGVTRRKK